MKKTELKMTDYYRITPVCWGEPSIMIDEQEAAKAVKECACLDELPDPDEDENDRPMEIQVGEYDGRFFAVHDDGDADHYQEIESPANVSHGTVAIISGTKYFD